MAKKQDGINRSEEIRKLLKTNPTISVKEAVTALGKKGIDVSDNLVYLVKGKMAGRKKRRKKKVAPVATEVAMVAAPTSAPKSDALGTILKVKAVASEVGGMAKLKSLIDALSE